MFADTARIITFVDDLTQDEGQDSPLLGSPLSQSDAKEAEFLVVLASSSYSLDSIMQED